MSGPISSTCAAVIQSAPATLRRSLSPSTSASSRRPAIQATPCCDPFAGCATTPIAAERLSRQWVAIDIWERAYAVVKQRLDDNRQLLTDADPQCPLRDRATCTQRRRRRSAVPFLQVTERYAEPNGPRMSRADMLEFLLAQHGSRCQGCDRTFDDPRYLELDHNTPRSDGGMNHITNRVLLCGPCNRLKSNQYTLSGLRRQNRRQGYMAALQVVDAGLVSTT